MRDKKLLEAETMPHSAEPVFFCSRRLLNTSSKNKTLTAKAGPRMMPMEWELLYRVFSSEEFLGCRNGAVGMGR